VKGFFYLSDLLKLAGFDGTTTYSMDFTHHCNWFTMINYYLLVVSFYTFDLIEFMTLGRI